MMQIEVTKVEIVRREIKRSHPFSEVFIDYTEDRELRSSYSRLFYALDDTPHARAAQTQAFLQRKRTHGW
jgi:hypothetical protein